MVDGSVRFCGPQSTSAVQFVITHRVQTGRLVEMRPYATIGVSIVAVLRVVFDDKYKRNCSFPTTTISQSKLPFSVQKTGITSILLQR